MKDMEFKNYDHKVMFDNFKGKILKTLDAIETQICVK